MGLTYAPPYRLPQGTKYNSVTHTLKRVERAVEIEVSVFGSKDQAPGETIIGYCARPRLASIINNPPP